jgi:O-antigen ligase
VIGIVISVHFISVYKSIIARLILIWLIPFLFYMLLQTGSRKAMVGLVLLLPFVGFGKAKATFTRNKLAGFGMLAVSLVLVASSVYYIMNSTYYFRLEDAMQAAESRDLSKADRSLRGRIALYEIGLKLAWDNPFLGVGLNNFRLTRTGGLFGHETGAYSHSNYIEVLVSTGFIGFALYFSVYGSLMLRLLKLRKAGLQGERLELYIVTTGLFLMYSVDDFAMVSFYEKASWLILATIMANIYLLERNAMTVLPKAAKKPAGGAAPTQNRPLFSGESTACRSLKARLGRSGEPH